MQKLIVLLSLSIILFSCEKESRDCPGSSGKTFNLTDFVRVNAGENFRVNIIKGNDYSIKATGCVNDLQDLKLSITAGETLDIAYNSFKRGRYRVNIDITMPVLVAMNGSGIAEFTAKGFDGQQSVIHTVLSGDADCKLEGTGINTNIILSGTSSLTVTGITESLYGTLSGDSRLYTYGLISQEVDIAVSSTSKAWVLPQLRFFVMASGDSRVYYKTDPPIKHFEITGTSKVIKE